LEDLSHPEGRLKPMGKIADLMQIFFQKINVKNTVFYLNLKNYIGVV